MLFFSLSLFTPSPVLHYAVITLLCWTFAAYASSRIARKWGASVANAARLGSALLVLIIVVPMVAAWPSWSSWSWFLLAGLLHLGLGDWGLFGAYRQLGPRLALLSMGVLSTLFAAIVDYLVLGTQLEWLDWVVMVAMLVAVVVALAPADRPHLTGSLLVWGVVMVILAAIGQAGSGLVTRVGHNLGDEDVPGVVGSALRVMGGLVMVAPMSLWALTRVTTPSSADTQSGLQQAAYDQRSDKSRRQMSQRVWPWLIASVLLGPVIGIAALHTAQSSAPLALVQAVLAMLPITMLPLAWMLDGDRPSARSLVAGVIAIGLLVLLVLAPWSQPVH